MITRIVVSLIGLPLLLAVLLVLPPVATAVLIAAMSVIAVYELLHRTGLTRNRILIALSMVMAVAVPVWSYFGCHWTWALIGLWVYFVGVICAMLASHGKLPFAEVCIAAFSGIVIPLLWSSLIRILLMEQGEFYILIPLVLAFSADSGAYFAGVAFGKHKMAPVISPKKTWEGFVGGIFAAMLIMLIYTVVLQKAFDLQVNYAAAVLFGAFGSVTSVIGDLVFSVIKRQTGIKDYGNLLPGHGGVLDRFDSMCLVAPLTESLLLLLPLIVG